MPAELPPPTPWGQLIRLARESVGLSIPAAAARAGISKGNWGHVERGYQILDGARGVQVSRGKAGTVARMAAAVGVTPEELAVAGRADAAEVLAVIVRRQDAEPARPDPERQQIMAMPGLSDAERAGLLSELDRLRADARADEPRRQAARRA